MIRINEEPVAYLRDKDFQNLVDLDDPRFWVYKNPTRAEIEDLSEDDEIIDLLLIYDEEKEYTNIIYDIDIEDLKKDKIRKIYITGDKAYNMALALKAMGLPLRKLIVDLELNIVLKLALSGKGKKLYIINMDDDTRSIEKQLKRLEKKWSI